MACNWRLLNSRDRRVIGFRDTILTTGRAQVFNSPRGPRRFAAASAFLTCSRRSSSSRYSFSTGLNNSVGAFGLVRRIAEREFEYLIMKIEASLNEASD